MLSALFLTASLVLQFEPSWTELGSCVVSASQDHDTIVVSDAQRTVHDVKLMVQRSDVRLNRVVFIFENGEQLEVRLHGLVPAGGETRTIHLKGNGRTIRRLDFWYDSKTIGRRGALIELVSREGKP